MFCPNCNEQYDQDTVFCGNCGKQIAPRNARGATVAEPTLRSSPDKFNYNAVGGNSIPRRPIIQSPLSPPPPQPLSGHTPPVESSHQASSAPSLGSLPTFQLPVAANNNRVRNIFIVLILVLLVGGVAAGFVVLAHRGNSNTATKGTANNGNTSALLNSSATAFFSDNLNGQGHSGGLKLTTIGLANPPSGFQYHAWMVDTNTEKLLPLGVLAAQGQNFSLAFAGKTSLIGAGNKLEVTQEQGTPSLPSGKLVLSATFPPLALIHIRHLLFSFETTPGKVGLLVGLRDQARTLNGQAALLKSLSTSGKGQNSIGCAAQSIVNLIEGKNGHNAQQLRTLCGFFNVTDVGDGFGLFDPANSNDGYVILSAEHAALAATQPDTNDTIRLHAGHVQIAMDNLKKWLTTIDKDALKLVANPGNTALIQEIVTLSDHTLNGIDLNDDEHVDPVPGEAGAITAYTHGQLMAQLAFTPGV